MEAIVHIGHEKTGSTSIQQFLLDYRKELYEVGIVYPQATKSPPPETRHGGYDIGLTIWAGKKTFLDQFRKTRKSNFSLKEAKKIIDADHAKEFSELSGKYAIYSFEGLQRLSWIEVFRLKRFFSRNFSKVTILFVVRRQDRWAVSANSTILAHGDFRSNIFNEIKHPHVLNYDRTARKWSTIFGKRNFVLKRFEDYDDITEILNEILDIDDLSLPKIKRHNTSISAEGQSLLYLLNSSLVREEPFASMSEAELSKLRKKIRNHYLGQSGRPSRSDALEFFQRYESSNRRLAAMYDKKTPAFFDDNFSEYSDKATFVQADPEAARKAILEMLQP